MNATVYPASMVLLVTITFNIIPVTVLTVILELDAINMSIGVRIILAKMELLVSRRRTSINVIVLLVGPVKSATSKWFLVKMRL